MQNGTTIFDKQTADKEIIEKALTKSAKGTTSLAGKKAPEINKILEVYKLQIAQALPKHITPDRMIQMCTTFIARNPKIAKCSEKSIIGGFMQASILGFPPVEALGYCYFVPYKNNKTNETECQFQIGYKGYMDLARRSGQIKMIFSEVVYKDDFFEYELGLEPVIKHVPNVEIDPLDSNITYVYAVVRYLNDGYNFVVLPRKTIESYRRRSPMQYDKATGAWSTDYAAMAKKTAIRRLSKYMPLNLDDQTKLLSDEQIITPDKMDTSAAKSGLAIENIEEAEYNEVVNGKE